MFECVRTVVTSFSDYESAVKLSVSKIREFLIDDDPNLRYLGLQALSVVAPKHLWAVLDNKEAVIKSLSDEDFNIKSESLRLMMAMVSESNVLEISRVLVNYALKSDPEFCNEILASILSTCCRNVYEIIIDFDLYVSLLGEMSRIPNCQKGEEIENQLIDIGMRVRDARLELIRVSRDLLIDPALLSNVHLHRVLCAAAWVAGEYVEVASNPFELMDALLQPRTNLLPSSIMAVYILSAFKVLTFCLDSFFLQDDNTAFSYDGNLAGAGPQLVVGKKCTQASDLAMGEGPNCYEQDKGFNPRNATDFSENITVENNVDRIVTLGQTSMATLSEKNNFTPESIVCVLNLVELALGPLTTNEDVEVLERACNVLSFFHLIKSEISDSSVLNVENKNDAQVSSVIKLMQDAFSEELGPVSLSAWGRVSVPDGLVLMENLDDLKTICGDIELTSSSSFNLADLHYGNTYEASSSILKNEDPGPSNESTSLVEHHKRHGLYYLTSGKKEIVSDDYPPAHELKLKGNINDDTEYLAKLTEQSLVLKRPNQIRPRPVVVKLDDGDVAPISVKRSKPREDSLSGAVRDILLGSETKPSSSRSNPSDRSSGKRKDKIKPNTNLPSETKENLADAEKPDLENPNSRAKHRSHNKERRRRRRIHGKTGEGEEHDQRGKKKSSHHHSRNKSRHRSNSPLNVVSQTPVIPDFLL